METESTLDGAQSPKFILVYGFSGRGKTFLASTLPDPSRVLILDAEQGTGSLKKTGIAMQKISLCRIKGELVPIEKRFERMNEFFKWIQTEECKARFDTIYLDSLTEISENVLSHYQEKTVGLKAYGDFKKSMIEFLKFLRDVGHYTVICTALEMREKEDGELFGPYKPKVGSAGVRDEVPQFFDLVTRLVLADGKRHLVCKETQVSYAKDRYGIFADVEEPNLGKLLAKITT